MTKSRTRLARFALPLAAAALVLTACGSATSSEETAPAAATSSGAEAEPAPEAESPAAEEAASEGEAAESPAAEEAAAAAGGYITLAEYEGSKDMYASSDVVLFFAADWCPTCQEATANLEADPAAIPAGLAIVRVDYDNSDDLKQKYGVTVQHTFVQVDADGNELAKWSGSVTADEIAKQTA